MPSCARAHQTLADAGVDRDHRRWSGCRRQRRQPRRLPGPTSRSSSTSPAKRRSLSTTARRVELGPQAAPRARSRPAPRPPRRDPRGIRSATRSPTIRSSGAPASRRPAADAVLWAVGRVRPNSDWLPAELLDDDGFVRVNADLQLPDHPEVFAIGDIAATDPLRTSARNRADKILARNIRAHLKGRPLKPLQATPSSLGLGHRHPGQRPDGLCAQRQGIPVPQLVDRHRPPATHRQPRHLPRHHAPHAPNPSKEKS